MGRFADYKKPKKEEPESEPNLRELRGSYRCQVCNEEVNLGLYSPEKSRLGWKCSKGHFSSVVLDI
jgi:hypothetical protein